MALARIIQLTSPASQLHVVSWTGEVLHRGPELEQGEQVMFDRLVRLCRSLGDTLEPWRESAVELRDGDLRGRALAFNRSLIYLSVQRGAAQERSFRAQALRLEQQRCEAALCYVEASC
jgi:hypothetical protein